MELLNHIATAKSQEYAIAVVFLVVFIFYWRLIAAPATQPVPVAEVARRAAATIGEMVLGFLVPEQVYFHPGHAWVKVEGDNVATVGIDDFAHRLMGPLDKIKGLAIGASLAQGKKAWTLYRDHKAVDMLSPIDGKIVAINEEALRSPQEARRDPYGEGWLLKVEAPDIKANMKNLLTGSIAKKWIEGVRESLIARSGPQLGLVYQDGGLPVDGMAASIDRDRWDEIAREFLLTSD